MDKIKLESVTFPKCYQVSEPVEFCAKHDTPKNKMVQQQRTPMAEKEGANGEWFARNIQLLLRLHRYVRGLLLMDA